MPLSTSPTVSLAKRWDVFISHASEDKQSVANPLADRLQRAGLKVWLDRQELKLGDSLREKIDQGLAESRFGVIILSPRFLLKHWPRQELNGLMGLEEDGRKVILPVWHDISREELKLQSPLLADRFAARTSEGLDEVAQKIVDVVMSAGSGSPSFESPSVTRRLLDLIEGNSEPAVIASFMVYHAKLIDRFSKFASMVTINGICVPLIQFYEGNSGTIVNFMSFGAVSGPLRAPDGTLADDIEAIISELALALAWCGSNVEAASRVLSERLSDDVVMSGGQWFRNWRPFTVRVVSRRRRDFSVADQRFLEEYNNTFREVTDVSGRSVTYRPILETYDRLVEQIDPAERVAGGR